MAEQVQTVLGNPVGGDEPLMAAGLDSLGATELQQGLADALGVELPSTLVFDYPTINAMAEFLASKLGQVAAPADAAASSLTASSALAHSAAALSGGAGWAVAILGAAGHGELGEGGIQPAGDASERVPYARWDADSQLITADGTLPAQVGGVACKLQRSAALATGARTMHTTYACQCAPPLNAFPLPFPLAVWCIPAGCGAI